MRSVPSIAVMALVASLLAGCASDPVTTSTSTTGEVLVTKPGDYAGDANGTNANLPHLHDYWGGQPRLVVMDGWPTQPGPGLAGGADVAIYDYRPASGHVIPQGTSQVEVTLTWTPEADDLYQNPQLWVKGASENQPHLASRVESGQKVVLNSTNELDDLPHQLLSAWLFQFRLSQRDDVGILRFKANVTIHVEAVRGLPIPLYPGHPDRWNGTSVMTLVDVTRQLAYLQDPGDAGCDGISCPQAEVPMNGTIVPQDAAYVEAILTVEQGSPQTVGLSYHGAEGRVFQRLQPVSTTGNERTYRIDVGAFGDGPYAKQSQWEFAPFIDGPAPDTLVVENYHLTVTVHRGV